VGPALGLAIADRDLPDDAGLSVARLADDAGLDSVWTNETGGADACVTLGAWAAATRRVRLATGVVPLSARSTATLALAASQLERLSGGRLILGIGVGQRAAAERIHHREWRPPLEWTREALGELRGAGHGSSFPVLVGALGPKMVALAGEAADGVLLNWTTAQYAATLRDRCRDAAAAAGRDPADLIVAGYVRVAAGPNAAEALRAQIGFYAKLPFYREHWAAMGDPADGEVGIASRDGRDLRERLASFEALDIVVARLVPTGEVGVGELAERICE